MCVKAGLCFAQNNQPVFLKSCEYKARNHLAKSQILSRSISSESKMPYTRHALA